MYLRGVLYESGIPQLSEGLIYGDSQVAIKLSTTMKLHDMTKYVRIRFNFVREAVRSNTIQLIHVPAEKMIADILTKAMRNRERHVDLTWALEMRETEP